MPKKIVQKVVKKEPEKEKDYEIKLSDLNFKFNLADATYELDALQNTLLQFYLRADPRFRRAFSMNYTQQFLQFMIDKARLKEPIHISILGQTRSGKSVSAITLCIIHSALNGRTFGIEYICGNAYEFIEKLKSMPEDKLINSIFLIDEQKHTVFGVGSEAKKLKIQDVQNIIAINNISTIMLTPIGWANKEAMYGLRVFGKCFKTKTCRLMLYNLQEKGKGGELPLGNIYLPIFQIFAPKVYAEKLLKQYLDKKNSWVQGEMRGEGDVLSEIKKKSAFMFAKDPKFQEIIKKGEKMAYITFKLGSEWTKGEVEEIYNLIKLIEKGYIS